MVVVTSLCLFENFVEAHLNLLIRLDSPNIAQSWFSVNKLSQQTSA